MARLWLRAGYLLFLALSWASFAEAHAVGLSRGVYQASEEGVSAALVLARAELDSVLPALDRDRNGSLSPGELTLARSELERWFVANLEVRSGEARCPGVLERAWLTEQDGLSVELRYRCPRGLHASAAVTLGFLNQLAHGHRHAAHLVSGSTARDEICFRGRSELSLARAESPPSRGSSTAALFGFVRMGFEHILVGYDHVVFLLALALTARRARSLLWVVTAFTLGHSVSLALVVFGVLSPSPAWVEPAIALSVTAVGVENLFRKPEDSTVIDRRWRLTLPFGLIHGFGFAGALQEVSIPRAELPAALFTFNLGVELGQLLLLALFLPLVLRLRRANWFTRRAVPVLSLAVVLAGVGWFVARLSPSGTPSSSLFHSPESGKNGLPREAG